MVLLDLYREQELLKKAISQKPASRVLLLRFRRVVRLSDRLREFGMIVQQRISDAVPPEYG